MYKWGVHATLIKKHRISMKYKMLVHDCTYTGARLYGKRNNAACRSQDVFYIQASPDYRVKIARKRKNKSCRWHHSSFKCLIVAIVHLGFAPCFQRPIWNEVHVPGETLQINIDYYNNDQLPHEREHRIPWQPHNIFLKRKSSHYIKILVR